METGVLDKSMRELVLRTCTELPPDILDALARSRALEHEGSMGRRTLEVILESAALSKVEALPICQDTGAPLVVVESPPGIDPLPIRDAVTRAIRDLTLQGVLRQNCVHPVTDANTLDNTGPSVPFFHFEPSGGPVIVGFMLKGGGSENVSAQYSLPHPGLDAGRDLEGVRRCLLDAVFQAQGKGCPPGVLGACIGGDRATGFLVAKMQLFRPLMDNNPDSVLADLERTVLDEANGLGIGPMGLGGSSTLLGCKIGYAGRHPACYYVTVSYSCWATRRYRVELDERGGIARWL